MRRVSGFILTILGAFLLVVAVLLRIWVALVLLALFLPIALILLYAFDRSIIESWPIPGFTLRWFSVAWHDNQVRGAFLLSLRVGVIATAVLLGITGW